MAEVLRSIAASLREAERPEKEEAAQLQRRAEDILKKNRAAESGDAMTD